MRWWYVAAISSRGGFETADGSAANYVAKWTGTNWLALGSGLGGHVVTALAISGSGLYAGGGLTAAGGTAPNYVAKWNTNGWSPLGSGFNRDVRALAISDSDVYAGGYFTTVGGSAANYIAKWNGSNWSALGSGMNNFVLALAMSANELYAAGYFTTAGGNSANHVAKWDGSSWSELGSGMNSNVSALAVSGGNVYAGGEFTQAGGRAANYIAKWDGSKRTALGSGVGGGTYPYAPHVDTLAVSRSDVYAGGYFTTAGGNTANGIAKWNGTNWSALGSGLGGGADLLLPYVGALAVSASDLYAGGDFTTAGGSAANHIAKWDGTAWAALGSGINYHVYVLAISGSDLFAGGEFSIAGGKVSAHIARAYLPTLPGLSVLRSATNVMVSWPTTDTAGFALEQSAAAASPGSWVTNAASVTDDGTNKSVTIPATNSSLFRLRRP